MHQQNQGYDPRVIAEFQKELEALGKPYKIVESEDNSEDYVNFQFIGKYEGRDVIYDAVIYTLRMQHQSEVYEIAEHRAAKRFPNYKKINYQEDENGDLRKLDDLEEEIGLFIAEVIDELEEEEAVKVQEHIELDPNLDFGVGLDAGLHVDVVDDEVITKFIKAYNDDTIKLDDTHYSFQSDDEIEA